MNALHPSPALRAPSSTRGEGKKFTKMHALGNDFIVIDGTHDDDTSLFTQPAFIQQIADRHRGIGFDQCLIIEPALSPKADFFYRIINANGAEVGQCGNGARCAARFIHEKQLSAKKTLILETRTTLLSVSINAPYDYTSITATLGVPSFVSQDIQTLHNTDFYALNIGNPHAIIHIDQIALAPVDAIGKIFNTQPSSLFPDGVNVEFMQIIDSQHLQLRVFERGAGETQACGSGACAAMICARQFYGTDATMHITLPGGTLTISWQGEGHPVHLTGDAVTVFEGVLALSPCA